jgi:hypothetical protein
MKHPLLSLPLVLLLAHRVLATTPLEIPLLPEGASEPAGFECEAETTVECTPPDGLLRLTNGTAPTITLFPPPAGTANGTAVLVCPGGGYNILAYSHEGTEVCQWLNSIDVTAALLKYRVPRRHTERLLNRRVPGTPPEIAFLAQWPGTVGGWRRRFAACGQEQRHNPSVPGKPGAHGGRREADQSFGGAGLMGAIWPLM